VLEYFFLFFIVWWAWLNGTYYHELHGNDDIRTRVFTFLQMFCVAGMAVFAHRAFGDGSVGFAVSYAAFQLILTYLWWRTGVHDPDHRPLSGLYTAAFLLNTALFVVSIFTPIPVRHYLWAVALFISLVLPLVIVNLGKHRPDIQSQIDLSTKPTHSLVERFGLFTIIVLGEVVVGVVQGAAGVHDLTWTVGGTAALGMTIAIGLWWVYFDYVSHRLPRPRRNAVSIWFYAHLPLTIGIASAGIAVLNVIEHSEDQLPPEVRWLLVVAIATVLLSIAVLIVTLQRVANYEQIFRFGRLTMVVAAILIFLLGFSGLEIIPLLVAIVVLLMFPVAVGLLAWIKTLGVVAT
jgi:low temperature requirement protein LtrA